MCKKKHQPYSKTQDFDAAIHQSKTWKGPRTAKQSIDSCVSQDTKILCSRKEETVRVQAKRNIDRGVPCETIVRCKGVESCNPFGVLCEEEDDDDDDRCEECNAGESKGHQKKKVAFPVLKQIRTLQKATKKEKTVAACNERKKGWQCLSVAVDSGACDNVIDPQDVSAYEDTVEETDASKNQENFLAANGEEIPNYGQMKVPAITREKTVRGITFQAAGVSKGLLSVEKMNECGHVVIFDGDASFIVNKRTGETNQLRRQDGNFMLDLWIPPPEVAQSLGFTRRH